ncbi:MAG: hypothetical protein Q4B26_20365 [Eubacteriales bacterium]|nr:hypothetical protein [Eubacteriales bacterium]
MGRMEAVDFRGMQRILSANGYRYERCRGSHHIYSNGEHTIAVNFKLNRMVARRIIKENALVV